MHDTSMERGSRSSHRDEGPAARPFSGPSWPFRIWSQDLHM